MKTLRVTCACLAAAAALLFTRTADAVPALVNYQGLLVNPDNSPLANGNYQVHFRIYDQPTGGSLIWGPQTVAAAVYNGQFNVLLGPTDTAARPLLDAFIESNRFLEIQVGVNAPISPRQQILSAPYALNASRLNGKGWDAMFDNGDPATGKIHGSRIAPGTIQQANLGPIYRLAASDGDPASALGIDANGHASFIGNVTTGGAVSASGNVTGSNISTRELMLTASAVSMPSVYATVALGRWNLSAGGVTTDYVHLKGYGTTLRLECNALAVTNLTSGTSTPLYWNSSTKQVLQSSSSRRYKDEIQPFHDDFSKVLSLEPKQYVRRDQPGIREVGYIAEDLDQGGLRAVTVYDAEGRPEAIDYARIIIYSNEILKQHQETIRQQQAELQTLKAEIESLRQLVLETR
jgi:hypothetical protein